MPRLCLDMIVWMVGSRRKKKKKKRKKKRDSLSFARFTEGTYHSDNQLVAESVLFRLCISSAIVWVDGVSTCSYRFVTSTPGMTNVDIVVFQIRTYTNFFLGFRSHNKTNFDDHIFFMYFFLQKMAKKYTKL